MTQSPDAPPLVFDDLASAVNALRDRGLRLSTARRLLLEALFAADGPVSAAHLAQTLSLEESSVYRNLELLEVYGLTRHVHLGHGPGLYVLVGRDELEYLYCNQCAKVTSVTATRLEPIRRQIKRQFGYDAHFGHFAIVGICEQCAAERQPSSPAQPDSHSGAGAPGEHHHRHAPSSGPTSSEHAGHEHAHSHGDFVHSHPHTPVEPSNLND